MVNPANAIPTIVYNKFILKFNKDLALKPTGNSIDLVYNIANLVGYCQQLNQIVPYQK